MLTGSNGLVGQHLIKEFLSHQNGELIATSLTENAFPNSDGLRFEKLDICHKISVMRKVREFEPDVIIHAAAMTQVDPCECHPEECFRVNVDGTRHLAEAAANIGAHFIFLSSDFVFNGENGPYREEDRPDPPSYYGWSKLQGEEITQSLSVPWSIVRTILVYGVTPFQRRSNIVLWVRNALMAGQEINVVDDQYRMPTWAGDLAHGIGEMVKRRRTGIFHLSGPEMLSVLDIALTVARFFNLDETLILPVSSRTLNQPGKRPASTGFYLDKARKELDYHPKKLIEGLEVVRNLLEKT